MVATHGDRQGLVGVSPDDRAGLPAGRGDHLSEEPVRPVPRLGPLDFQIPEAGPTPWRRWVDTSLPSPDDILEHSAAPTVPGPKYRVTPRSIVLLISAMPT